MQVGRAFGLLRRHVPVRVKHPLLCNQKRGKALQNWKRPSMDEYLPPREPWQRAYNRKLVENNAKLGQGIGFLAFVIGYGFYSDTFPTNTELQYLKSLHDYPAKPKQNVIKEDFPDAVAMISADEVISQPRTESTAIEDESMLREEDETAWKTSENAATDAEVIDNEKETDWANESKSGNEAIELEREELSERKSPNGFPEEVPYLIIGGGTAAFSAFRAIKAREARAKVLIISNEDSLPYMKPPLSKELWYSEKISVSENELNFKSVSGRERNLFFEKGAFFTPADTLEFNDKGGVSVLKGYTVVHLDTDKQLVTLHDGKKVKYGKCLIATGGRPKKLQQFQSLPEDRVTTFRTVEDFLALDALIGKKSMDSVAIVGGGFLGTELACSLKVRGKKNLKVTQVFPEKGILAKVLPEYLSQVANGVIRKEGVDVISDASIQTARINAGGKIEIGTNKGTVVVDHVVLAVGTAPNTQLAESSGLQTDSKLGGFVANAMMEASKPNIYVAGDVASFYHPELGCQSRFEHHDNAIVSGKVAGENMAGGQKEVTSEPMFWSDFGLEVGIEAIGTIDSQLETVGIYAKESETDFDRGVVFYKNDEDVVVGVLLWNIFNHISIARRVVREKRKYEDLTEVAKLFNMYKKPQDDSGQPEEESKEGSKVSEEKV